MKGKPDVAHLVASIENHKDVVLKEIYRAFYYQRKGWMWISPKDTTVMSNFLAQRQKRIWKKVQGVLL